MNGMEIAMYLVTGNSEQKQGCSVGEHLIIVA